MDGVKCLQRAEGFLYPRPALIFVFQKKRWHGTPRIIQKGGERDEKAPELSKRVIGGASLGDGKAQIIQNGTYVAECPEQSSYQVKARMEDTFRCCLVRCLYQKLLLREPSVTVVRQQVPTIDHLFAQGRAFHDGVAVTQ
jgi:hypothetical protein